MSPAHANGRFLQPQAERLFAVHMRLLHLNASLLPEQTPSSPALVDASSEDSWRVLLAAVGYAVSAATVLGNGLTLFAVGRIKKPGQSSVSNLYIASLAAADLLVGAVVMTGMVTYSVVWDGRWQGGTVACDLWQATDFVAVTISLYSICAIGFDRWWNLEKPLRVFRRNRALAKRIIAAVWLSPLFVWAPTLVALRRANGGPPSGDCSTSWEPPWVVLLISFPFLHIPVLVLVVVFFRITFVIRSHMAFLVHHSSRTNLPRPSRSNIFDSLTPLGVSPNGSSRNSRRRRCSVGFAEHNGLGAVSPPPLGRTELVSPRTALRILSEPPPPPPPPTSVPNGATAHRLLSSSSSSGSVNRIQAPTFLAPLAEVSSTNLSSASVHQRPTQLSAVGPAQGARKPWPVAEAPTTDGPPKEPRRPPTLLDVEEASSVASVSSHSVGTPDSNRHRILARIRSEPPQTLGLKPEEPKRKRISVTSDTAYVYTKAKDAVKGKLRPPLLRAKTEHVMEIRQRLRADKRRSSRFSVIAIKGTFQGLHRPSVNLFSELLPGSSGLSQQIRAAKAVGLLLGCFLLSWIPFLVLWPLRAFCPGCVSEWWYRAAIWANYANSTINPILYTLCSPRVRATLRASCSGTSRSASRRKAAPRTRRLL